MSRIGALSPAEVDSRTREYLTAITARFGRIPNIAMVMSQSPAVLDGFIGLSGALEQGLLPHRLRRQIAIAAAQANGCGYSLAAHMTIGRNAGLSDEEVEASRRTTSAAYLDLVAQNGARLSAGGCHAGTSDRCRRVRGGHREH